MKKNSEEGMKKFLRTFSFQNRGSTLLAATALSLQLISCSAAVNTMDPSGAALSTRSQDAVYSAALPIPRSSRQTLIKGSFFQPGLVVSWDSSKFASEFQYMRDVKMDHAIWQWTVNSKPGIQAAYYPTTLPGLVAKGDLVAASLIAAKDKGLQVWLGLNWNDDWFKMGATDTNWISNEFLLSRQIASELWSLYGSGSGAAIAGFYITMEMDNLNFQSAAKQDLMKNAYQTTCDFIHTTTGKPVMVAPFFNKNVGQNASAYAAMWGSILRSASIDIVAMQDGVGVHHAGTADLALWFSEMRGAIQASRPSTKLWSDLETFDETVGGGYVSAPVSRVITQFQKVAPYVDKVTSFSFNHYDSPNRSRTNEYAQWKAYSDTH